MTIQPCFSGLRWVGFNKHGIGMREGQAEVVDTGLGAIQQNIGFAKISLPMSRWVMQLQEDFL